MTPYERLERWLAARRPQILDNLQPPASDAELADVSETLGVSLPPSFLDLYRWRNGQRDASQSGPFYGLSFLSIADVLAQWESWNEILADDDPDLHGFSSSVVPGVVKERYANRMWIPFSHDWGGNHIGVDLDPGQKGRVGQVINFGRDEDAKYVLGQTVEAFVARIADELERGNFVLMDPPDGGFDTKTPPSSHFLDAARVWFGG
jgi:cell wall assembly regulator SMI1